ncbi:hypothetical protein BB561_005066 [Smittium simulii]|uniref:Carbohydrate-binding module family 19 domain-containing protein n=1 Tax=Smittium simulii TaxID=133385 RepID=A0A2T9YCI9_9FUNG|nr:hypothetical protein BB561_005066 [Smittium simulii]
MLSIKSLLSTCLILQAFAYPLLAKGEEEYSDLNIRDTNPEENGYDRGYSHGYRPQWKDGDRKCNKYQNGYNECIRGKIRFIRCHHNHCCVMTNGHGARCVPKKYGHY